MILVIMITKMKIISNNIYTFDGNNHGSNKKNDNNGDKNNDATLFH